MQQGCERRVRHGVNFLHAWGLPPSPHMSSPTFAECFCAKHNIPREEFARFVFNRVLYRRTHVVKWLLPLLDHNYFAADFDLIYSVESLRRNRDFALEVQRFNEHPANRGWLRRTMCLRVSTARLKRLVRETLPRAARTAEDHGAEDNDGTVVPFEFAGRAGENSDSSSRLKAAGGV